MANWLSSPKVRLGMLVNGLYLISLVTPSAHHGRPHGYSNDYGRPGSATTRRPPVYVDLPPAAGPSKATSYRGSGGGDLTVYLDGDLMLSGARGRRLLLSPLFNVHEGDGSPESVLLRFVSFSDRQLFSTGARLVISADGKQVWPADGGGGERVWEGWKEEEELSPDVTATGQGEVAETVRKSIPYEVFADVIRARCVVLNLGPHLVELNAVQLEALRDMHRLVSQPPTERFVRRRF